MRFFFYVDADGYRRRVLLRDNDRDSDAERIGIPADPPDLAGLGLSDAARRDLHNMLSARGLFTWQDVQAIGNGVTATLAALARQHNFDRSALKQEIVRRYRGR
jgi:hypothetical protein